MESVGDILYKYLRDLGLAQSLKRFEVLRIWPEVVGDSISRVTEPQRLSDGILFVKVNNQTWRNELIYYKSELIRKVNIKMEFDIIRDIKFF